MNLAIRVRDYRYAKGWGPDELASRAEISRTALYQIESGRTGLPRAGTLRRIAMALDVTMEDLLGSGNGAAGSQTHEAPGSRKRRSQWVPHEGGPLSLPAETSQVSNGFTAAHGGDSRFGVEKNGKSVSGIDSTFIREGELISKLHDLLHSPLGGGLSRVIDDLHALLNRGRSSH